MKKAVLFLIVRTLLLGACGGDSNTEDTSSKNATSSQKKQMSWETEMEPDEAITLVKSYISDNCDANSHYIEYPDFFEGKTTMGGWTVYYRHSPAQGAHSTGEWQVRESTKAVTAIWDEDCL